MSDPFTHRIVGQILQFYLGAQLLYITRACPYVKPTIYILNLDLQLISWYKMTVSKLLVNNFHLHNRMILFIIIGDTYRPFYYLL